MTAGIYLASKRALEGLSETLILEVRDLGIHVTLIEPDGVGSGRVSPLPSQSKRRASDDVPLTAASVAVLNAVDAQEPPLHCFLGNQPSGLVKAYTGALERFRRWQAARELSGA